MTLDLPGAKVMKQVCGKIAFAAASLIVLASGATADVYTNDAVVSNPQINATTVVNSGTINVGTPLPFETWNTLNVTNTGTMVGSAGFRFDYKELGSNSNSPAANFVNLNAGMIQANDFPALYVALDTGAGWVPIPSCVVASVEPSKLFISADNIVNRSVGANGASLLVGPNGGLHLDGNTIDLTRSGLEVIPVWVQFTGDQFQPYDDQDRAYFEGDVAIYDFIADSTTFNEDYVLGTAGLWDGEVAAAPGIPARDGVTPSGSPGFQLTFPEADSYINYDPETITNITVTNIIGDFDPVEEFVTALVTVPGNVYKGAVFVGAPPGFNVQLGFVPGTEDFLNNIGVLLSTPIRNEVTGVDELAYIYFSDDLAGEEFRSLSTNLIGCLSGQQFRPQNYRMNRLNSPAGNQGNHGYPPPDFFTSSESRALLEPEFIGFDSVSNSVVEAGDVTGYQALLDNIVSRPPAVPGGTVTNNPGRVRINASESLDMSRTRIRGEGEIIVNAAHLISSSRAVIDCENLSFALTSTNGLLEFNNLSKDTVNRLRGTITTYSALWSNTVTLIITNNHGISNVVATNMAGEEITNQVGFLNPLTNEISVVYHTLMLDARALQTVLPVTVYDLVVHSTNVVIDDNAAIVSSLLIDGESFTINSNSAIQLPGFYPFNPVTGLISPLPALTNWNRLNAPALLNFTNHGSFSIPLIGSFGADGPVPYSRFVNTGSINAENIRIQSDALENTGILSASGPMLIEGGTVDLLGGQTFSGRETEVVGIDVRLNNCQIVSGDVIEFRATNSLKDAGPSSGSVLDALFGFRMPIKPATGDLLGTTFQNTAPTFNETMHTWAGEDRGTNVTGYVDNVAVGHLVLSVMSEIFGGQFLSGSTGGGVTNGLYIDVFDISGLGQDYEELLRIDTNLVVYFAAAEVGFTPVGNLQPEEVLDGQFGNRLRWVSSYAGPNSSIPVIVDGQSTLVNSALRNSKVIDSNNDGVPNYYDATPFDSPLPLAISLTTTPTPTIAVQWNAAPQTVYRVDCAEDFVSPEWEPLMWVTNSTPTNKPVVVYDTNAPMIESQRFYRVQVLP